ncbi:hypothetical protein SAMD00019534_043130 [Acytostelium subglobosum LB1]|uniref:hypothetical protein n=1 Tax=Acytostelium subglobosum LB1 TaxID=1410327 RepID=UPI000644C70D|nr:hypothetical protein SAMD00019534_043130 [Acytostelium subglobosum LB1]GAM21138.1 hypothetical protein SAMD00019534_043130 [Acytostelium subglobosum LB1]|eukprot:XP_012756272.1 hypothetical protein SAMD00019534_043130 [Acytostelium subglobosum LB1]
MLPLFIKFNVFNLLFLQILIAISGNYGIFNLNSMVISLIFLDDSIFPSTISSVINYIITNNDQTIGGIMYEATFASIALGIVAITLILSFIPLTQLTRGMVGFSNKLVVPYMYVSKFGLLNYYGLFASMTTSRKEILFQGSTDGQEWHQYEFNWKPGDLDVQPRFIIGHLPRLEWRLWFCQFESFGTTGAWFDSFCDKLLRNEPSVVGMLRKNPFAQGTRPKYLRCLIASYKFSEKNPYRAVLRPREYSKKETQELCQQVDAQGQATIPSDKKYEEGKWWRKGKSFLYYPILSLKDGELVYRVQRLE